jgi:uncharacterized protein (UPF0332 family)
MNPADFLKTADLLKVQTEEAHWRTSVGRSYYAAFLYFREKLKRLGLVKTKEQGLEEHAFVIKCLQFSEVSEGVQVAQCLRNLKQSREDADYRLDREFSQNDAGDAFVKAQKVIEDYQRNISPEKERELIKGATGFAKQKDWI